MIETTIYHHLIPKWLMMNKGNEIIFNRKPIFNLISELDFPLNGFTLACLSFCLIDLEFGRNVNVIPSGNTDESRLFRIRGTHTHVSQRIVDTWPLIRYRDRSAWYRMICWNVHDYPTSDSPFCFKQVYSKRANVPSSTTSKCTIT